MSFFPRANHAISVVAGGGRSLGSILRKPTKYVIPHLARTLSNNSGQSSKPDFAAESNIKPATKATVAGVAVAVASAAAYLASATPVSLSDDGAHYAKPNDRKKSYYPQIEPYDHGMLKVSPIHTVYYEQSGNPKGKPVVVLHGGPGGGSSSNYRRYFDPKEYRIIQFDQRGCGKSTPHACLEDNTTWSLVDDIEKLRKHLKVDKWMVFGGSWGSTLSLAYAETHPGKVTELVLRGIFMLRQKELKWFYQDGASFVFPDVWESYRDAIPAAERGDFMQAYHKRLTGKDENEKLKAATAWTTWEQRTCTLLPRAMRDEDEDEDPDWFAIAFARIENHYFVNKGFFPEEDYLLKNVDKIRHIPTVIVQGRYDMVCPAISAWELHRAFPESQLWIVQDAGHSCAEPGIVDKLIEATEKFKPSSKS